MKRQGNRLKFPSFLVVPRERVSSRGQRRRRVFNCASKDKRSPRRWGIAITRSDFYFLYPQARGYLVHYAPSEVRKNVMQMCVCVCRRGGGKRTARGRVSLKNRVAIPVSTWRKMAGAFHAPTLFSQFLAMNSSASHYGKFPRERTQHKLLAPTVEHGRLKTASEEGSLGERPFSSIIRHSVHASLYVACFNKGKKRCAATTANSASLTNLQTCATSLLQPVSQESIWQHIRNIQSKKKRESYHV